MALDLITFRSKGNVECLFCFCATMFSHGCLGKDTYRRRKAGYGELSVPVSLGQGSLSVSLN